MDEAILHRARHVCREMSDTELLEEYVRLSDYGRPEARLAVEEELERRNLEPPPPVVHKPIILTTAPGLDGYVARTIEIISAERSFGINVSSDFRSRRLHGDESFQESVRNVFREARRRCLTDLRREPRSLAPTPSSP